MIIAGNKAAAEALGVTERQLARWRKEAWFPKEARTKAGWDVERIRAARDQEGRKGSEESATRAKVRDARAAEQLKRERIRTEADQLDLARKQGSLISRASIELFVATFLTEFGDWCDQLPGFTARLVKGKDQKRVREKLQKELDERRVMMRDALKAKLAELDGAAGQGQTGDETGE